KAVERQVLDKVIDDALWALPQYQDYLYGTAIAEDYEVWWSAVERRAERAATDLGCTAAAKPYLLAARDMASRRIYQDLLVLFHYNGLPAEDPQRVPLSADQTQAANGYAEFLKQVYGANFTAFAAAQREAAAQSLVASSSTLRVVHFEIVAEIAG